MAENMPPKIYCDKISRSMKLVLFILDHFSIKSRTISLHKFLIMLLQQMSSMAHIFGGHLLEWLQNPSLLYTGDKLYIVLLAQLSYVLIF